MLGKGTSMSMLLYLWLCLCWCRTGLADVGRLVCYYDAASFLREGPAQLSIQELEPALNFCNVLVYGYAGIDAETFKLKSLHPELSHSRGHYRSVTALKRKYPHVSFLLSVGGDRDANAEGVADTAKYLSLLELPEARNSFRSSALAELNQFGFDGLDLAWQFPKNKPKQQRGALKKAWHVFKGWFSNPSIDSKSEEHKQQFSMLLRELKSDFRSAGKLLTLSMLPHVDAALFIDIEAALSQLDFVSLGTYDFHTPEREPQVADLPAPLHGMYDRDAALNVDYQVRYWLNHTANAQKLHIGVSSYGRAWKMTRDSGITGYPPIPATEGAAPMAGINGLLSWPEICERLQQPNDKPMHLRKVGDPTKRFGVVYAYRADAEDGQAGLWVGYEDPTTAAIKASYAQAQGLGGVAFHELSLDDFGGQCAGEKFPILRSIKYKL